MKGAVCSDPGELTRRIIFSRCTKTTPDVVSALIPVNRCASCWSEDTCGGQHMYRAKSCMVLMVALFVLPTISSVQAQWVMAAHAVKNRVQQMTQKSDNEGYDVAMVVLEAAPAAVYDKTIKSLQSHPEITITKNDGKTGRIEIRKGKQVGGFQISPIGEQLTQLVIASSVSEGEEPSPTSLVVDGVLRVCKEVGVKCTVEPN